MVKPTPLPGGVGLSKPQNPRLVTYREQLTSEQYPIIKHRVSAIRRPAESIKYRLSAVLSVVALAKMEALAKADAFAAKNHDP